MNNLWYVNLKHWVQYCYLICFSFFFLLPITDKHIPPSTSIEVSHLVHFCRGARLFFDLWEKLVLLLLYLFSGLSLTSHAEEKASFHLSMSGFRRFLDAGWVKFILLCLCPWCGYLRMRFRCEWFSGVFAPMATSLSWWYSLTVWSLSVWQPCGSQPTSKIECFGL